MLLSPDPRSDRTVALAPDPRCLQSGVSPVAPFSSMEGNELQRAPRRRHSSLFPAGVSNEAMLQTSQSLPVLQPRPLRRTFLDAGLHTLYSDVVRMNAVFSELS